MKPQLKNIVIQAIKNGFDLNQFQTKNNPVTLEEIEGKLSSKYLCTIDGGIISIGTLYDDLLTVWIEGDTLRIRPSNVDGVFESIIEIFRFLYNRTDKKPSFQKEHKRFDYSKYLGKTKGIF